MPNPKRPSDIEKSEYKSNLSKWLDSLHQESWQLELLISGFSIFLLVGAKGPIDDFTRFLNIKANTEFLVLIRTLLTTILNSGWIFMVINLSFHVVLRGLWIGTIGLRSVSPFINYDYLKYTAFFTEKLKKKIGSYDDYIIRLDKLASLVFSFTFLAVFIAISIALFFFWIGIFSTLVNYLMGASPSNPAPIWAGAGVIVLVFIGFLYFLDFVTFGIFKKVDWLQKVYYPIYKVLGYLTLAIIYRPIVHNFLSNKFSRKVALFLVPYVIISFATNLFYIGSHSFFPKVGERLNPVVLYNRHYDNLLSEGSYINMASIPSKNVDGDMLELFLEYNPRQMDATLKHFNPDVLPSDFVGIRSGLIDAFKENKIDFEEYKDNSAKLLNCFNDVFIVHLDTTKVDIGKNALFYKHPITEELGILNHIDISDLDRGLHNIHVEGIKRSRTFKNFKIDTIEYAIIPFWKD